jgi:hypothetical protein
VNLVPATKALATSLDAVCIAQVSKRGLYEEKSTLYAMGTEERGSRLTTLSHEGYINKYYLYQ